MKRTSCTNFSTGKVLRNPSEVLIALGKIIVTEEHNRPVKILEKDQSAVRSAIMSNYVALKNTVSWEKEEKSFTWKESSNLNAAHEAVDRWVAEGYGDKVAVRVVDEGFAEEITFKQLMDQSNQFANLLKRIGIKRGDPIFILMPASCRWYVAFFGILKVGAIPAPLLESFTSDSYTIRIKDARAPAIVTTPGFKKRIAYPILKMIKFVILNGEDGDWGVYGDKKVFSWDRAVPQESAVCTPVWVNAGDPMLLQYTSRPKEKPKGILLPHGDMTFLRYTGKNVLDFKDGDIFWCTFDLGHITGCLYGILSPLLNGGVKIIHYRGRYDAHLWYQVIQNERISVWYTSPTALRLLKTTGQAILKNYKFNSVRFIGSVGEPLTEDLVDWSIKEPPEGLGLPIHDTWWMTETGGIIIANFPATRIKIGSIGLAVPGANVAIINEQGEVLPPYKTGFLAIQKGWPGMFTEVWGDLATYQSYFRLDPWFVSIDRAFMDNDGYFWFKAPEAACEEPKKVIGPFEIEQKLMEHPSVAEVGVIGIMDSQQGNIVKAYVKPAAGKVEDDTKFKEELVQLVSKGCGAEWVPKEIILLPFTTPDGTVIEELPKTRSGKIMRRILQGYSS